MLNPTASHSFGIDESHLVDVSTPHKLTEQTATALSKLQCAASQAGFDLQLISSFRSFARQQAIWDAKWHAKRPVLDLNSHPLDLTHLDDYQKINAIMLYSALPGASRHHWGTDFDYYDANTVADINEIQLVEAEYICTSINPNNQTASQAPCAGLHSWLKTHSHEFGFYFPYDVYRGGVAAEPWHLSFYPEATKFDAVFCTDKLAQLLKTHRVAGFEIIQSHLTELAAQFIKNVAQHTS